MTKRNDDKIKGLFEKINPLHLIKNLPHPYKSRILREFGEVIHYLEKGKAKVCFLEKEFSWKEDIKPTLHDPNASVDLELEIETLSTLGVLLDFGALMGEALCRVWRRVVPSVVVQVKGAAVRGIDGGEEGKFDVTLSIHCWSLEEIFGSMAELEPSTEAEPDLSDHPLGHFPGIEAADERLTPEDKAVVSLLTSPVEELLRGKSLEFFKILKEAWGRGVSREKITRAVRRFLKGEKVEIAKCPMCDGFFPLTDGRTLTCSPRCRQRKRRKGFTGKLQVVMEFEPEIRRRKKRRDPKAQAKVISEVTSWVIELCRGTGYRVSSSLLMKEAFEKLKASGVIDSECYPLVEDFEEKIKEILGEFKEEILGGLNNGQGF